MDIAAPLPEQYFANLSMTCNIKAYMYTLSIDPTVMSSMSCNGCMVISVVAASSCCSAVSMRLEQNSACNAQVDLRLKGSHECT